MGNTTYITCIAWWERKSETMEENIFMAGKKQITFEEYLQYDAESRGNLGAELPVIVYRLLEYSLKDELIKRYGKEEQIDIFRKAGRKAGEFFAKKLLNLDQPLDQFVGELHAGDEDWSSQNRRSR